MPSSPPDWLNAHGDATPVIDAESHVREYAERRGRDPNENCPALVIGGFINLMVEPLAEAVGAGESDVRLGLQGPKTIDRSKGAAEDADSLRPGLRIGELDGHPIGVARIPVGGARSVMTLEELMALARAHVPDRRRHRGAEAGDPGRRLRDCHQRPTGRGRLVSLPAARPPGPRRRGQRPAR